MRRLFDPQAYRAVLFDQRGAGRSLPCPGDPAAIVSVETGGIPDPRYAGPRFRMGFARLVTHYFSHAAWLEEDQLLREAHKLSGLPGVLIHGRLELGSPLETTWPLARAWPGSELIVLDTSGHASTDLGDHVVAATDRFVRPPWMLR
jgi:proline iminopeptidase